MDRPKKVRHAGEGPELVILIPARNEEENLKELLPRIFVAEPHQRVYVFDDESTDRTAKVARDNGAIVIQPREPLPAGWTGKNRACDALAKAAIEDSNSNWMIFLDADTVTDPNFIGICRDIANSAPKNVGVVSAFPRLAPGSPFEPLFLAWVPYVLLASNPFGIVSKTGIGHNQFTNGQFTLWRKESYEQIWPNATLRDRILEDVQIGRLLKKSKLGLRVINLSKYLAVKMYKSPREAFDGLSKNSYEIAGNTIGSLVISFFLLFLGFGWMFAGPRWPEVYALLCLSGLFSFMTVRMSIFNSIAMPFNLLIGAMVVLRSILWHRSGKVQWKGRTYPAASQSKTD